MDEEQEDGELKEDIMPEEMTDEFSAFEDDELELDPDKDR